MNKINFEFIHALYFHLKNTVLQVFQIWPLYLYTNHVGLVAKFILLFWVDHTHQRKDGL